MHRSRLRSSIHALVEGDTESAVSRLASFQKVCFECKDVDGVAWSRHLLQSTLKDKQFSYQSQDALFCQLVKYFIDHEKHLQDVHVESSVALAALHMAERSENMETGMNWLLKCLQEARTDHLKLEAAIALGTLLLNMSNQPEEALKWFRRAKELGSLCKLPDSTAVASYRCGQSLLALNQVAAGLAAVEQNGTKLNDALACMLEAEAQGRRADCSSLEATISSFTKARTSLVPLMPDIYVNLNTYLASKDICCRECFLSYLGLDGFTEVFIENFSRFTVEEVEQAPEPTSRAFFIYKLYRESRLKMIRIQSQVVPFQAFMDPRPYLEHGIEMLRLEKYSEDPSSEALEALVTCQQVALAAGHTSAVFWTSGYIDVYLESQGKRFSRSQETVLMQLAECFRTTSYDGEDAEAWAAYYAGRVGKELKRNSKPDVEMLKHALERSRTPALGYYAALAIGNTYGYNPDAAVQFYEVGKLHALRTGREDLIVSAFLLLFGHLVDSNRLGTERYEDAERVRAELLRLSLEFKDPMSRKLAQAAESYMEGLLLDDRALNFFETCVSVLESLPRFPALQLYRPYLSNGQGDGWSADMNFLAQTLHSNAVKMLRVIRRDGSELQALEELDAADVRNCLFFNWILRIDTLCRQEKLAEAEAEAAELLHELEELEEPGDGSYPSLDGMFGALVRYYLASICFAYHSTVRTDKEYTFDVVDELMQEAGRLSGPLYMTGSLAAAHGAMQTRQGRFVAAAETLCRALNRTCLQMERKFGRYSAGRINNLQRVERTFALLQAELLTGESIERALIWEERKRARDLVYILREEEVEEFDRDDEVAWEELCGICEMIGRETVVLVMTQMEKYLFLFLLHSGESVLTYEHSLGELEVPLGFPGLDAFERNSEEEFHVLAVHYDILIRPFEEALEVIQPERIIFVPSKDLWYFPFNALLDRTREENKYLVERYVISSVSSLRLLKHCELRRRELEKDLTSELSSLSSLVVGNPTLDLDEAATEAEFVAGMMLDVGFHRVDRPAPEESTKEEVLRLLPLNNWIHIASHADVNEEFAEGVLFLAPGSDREEHGTLTTDELQRKLSGGLKASAVVLSACKSGVGSLFRGEGVVALPRSFHACGVPSVVMSLWEVPDSSAPVLMRYFYSSLAEGMDIAASLRKAIVAMIHEQDEYWEEPVFDLKSWAPFVVSGSPFTRLVSR